jgi:acyl carrier protein
LDEIKQTIKGYILQEFLPGEDPANLTDDLELLRSGVLDSISTLKLVALVEERYGIQFEAHEVSANFSTIDDIARLVASKRS